MSNIEKGDQRPGDSTSKSGDDPSKPGSLNYKFRDVKVYSSDEWMTGSTKKYRKVFDRYETTYIRVEFSFFNKLFDEKDWEADVLLKCFSINGSQKAELCSSTLKHTVSREDNIKFIRYSWGNPTPGAYWLRGTYLWEAYVDGDKAGETTFYVEDVGQARPGENLYLEIDSIRMFAGDLHGDKAEQKVYLSKFSQKETCYVWAEVNFRNKSSRGYMAEFIFNYYDSDGLSKGSYPYLIYVSANTQGKIYTASAGWGSTSPGTWGSDTYTLEVIFLDMRIATVPFVVGDSAQPGSVEILTDVSDRIREAAQVTVLKQKPQTILQESLEELNALTGLTEIKKEVNEMVRLVQFYQETGKDVLNKFSLHSVFTGNPGTGKTTVARILSRIYQGLGILERGHLVEVDREGLVAGYVGQTAIKTSDRIGEAMGGILFIDEAYSLAQERGSPYDFGGESIQVILKRMEDQRGKFGVIVAGYTKNMHDFINSNPGLRSRFDKYFEFPDYTPDEMFIIALAMFRKEEVMPDVDAAMHLKAYFSFLYERRNAQFGNARTVRQTVAESVKNQHLRLAAMKKEERTADLMATVIFDDVAEFELMETGSRSRKIGFKRNMGQ